VEYRHPLATRTSALPAALPYPDELSEFLDVVVTAGETCEVLPITPELLLLVLVEQVEGVVDEVIRMRRLSRWRLRRWLRGCLARCST
jgi:hypothetical protein